MIKVRTADTHFIGGVMLCNSFSSMIAVSIHSQKNFKLYLSRPSNVVIKTRRLLSTLLSKWENLCVKFALLQFKERCK